jgi:acyl-CoA thioester hydrolase
MKEHLPAMPPQGRHRYTVRVYFEDTDAGGVVYHAGYLRFAERARTEALRDLGVPHAEMVAHFNLMFMVRRIEMDYLRPARLDESLTVVTEVMKVGGASALLRQSFLGSAGVCAVAMVRLACVQAGGNNKPGRMPDRWREVLEALRDAGTQGAAANPA